MESLFNVIQKFIVTNKSTDGELRGVYTCFVDPRATKIDIKNAFTKIYGVAVAQVNILKTRQKFHNTKTGPVAKRGIQKKAMVTLATGTKINDFTKVI
jgi:large subunit ribosomal protein L23